MRYEGFPADQLLVFGDVLVELGELAVDTREIRARGSGGLLLHLELCNRDLIVGDVRLELALKVLGRAKRAGQVERREHREYGEQVKAHGRDEPRPFAGDVAAGHFAGFQGEHRQGLPNLALEVEQPLDEIVHEAAH